MNLKAMFERRNALVEEATAITAAAEQETRALTDEEQSSFDEKVKEIRALDNTIQAMLDSSALEKRELTGENKDREEMEIRSFANYVRNTISEQRDDTNLTQGDNGAIIPQIIARKIIEKVKELSPIYSLATVYNVSGKLIFPVWEDNGSSNIKCTYATEFTDLTSESGKFAAVELNGYLAGALTKVSKSLISEPDFDLVDFVVRKIAEAIAEHLEKEMIVGTSGKMTGILSAEVGVTTAASTAITGDELVDMELSIPEQFTKNACWIMHKTTFAAIRKLKDSDGNYMLIRDFSKKGAWELLGHPVHVTESMPTIAAGAKAIAYGDMSGLYLKMSERMEIQVLNELFAAQHAIGVVGWINADSKLVEPQKIRLLQMKV